MSTAFQVGDRVVVQGLQDQEQVGSNGCHGSITECKYHNNVKRFQVNLDTQPDKAPILATPDCLRKEQPEEWDPTHTIKANGNGILPCLHGHVVANILKEMKRNSSSNVEESISLVKEKVKRRLISKNVDASPGNFWRIFIENSDTNPSKKAGRKSSDKDCQKFFLHTSLQVIESPLAVARWPNLQITAEFYYTGRCSEETGAAFLISKANPSAVYEVFGIQEHLGRYVDAHNTYSGSYPLTVKLMPFYNIIVGEIDTEQTIKEPKQASKKQETKLSERLAAAIRENRIVKSFHEAELSSDDFVEEVIAPLEQPPSDEEKALVTRLGSLELPDVTDLSDVDLSSPASIKSYFDNIEPWTLSVRHTKPTVGDDVGTNTQCLGTVFRGKRATVAKFEYSLFPTTLDSLSAVVQFAESTQRQPKVLLLDDLEVFLRCTFLLKDVDMGVEYFNPEDQIETSDSIKGGPPKKRQKLEIDYTEKHAAFEVVKNPLKLRKDKKFTLIDKFLEEKDISTMFKDNLPANERSTVESVYVDLNKTGGKKQGRMLSWNHQYLTKCIVALFCIMKEHGKADHEVVRAFTKVLKPLFDEADNAKPAAASLNTDDGPDAGGLQPVDVSNEAKAHPAYHALTSTRHVGLAILKTLVKMELQALFGQAVSSHGSIVQKCFEDARAVAKTSTNGNTPSAVEALICIYLLWRKYRIGYPPKEMRDLIDLIQRHCGMPAFEDEESIKGHAAYPVLSRVSSDYRVTKEKTDNLLAPFYDVDVSSLVSGANRGDSSYADRVVASLVLGKGIPRTLKKLKKSHWNAHVKAKLLLRLAWILEGNAALIASNSDVRNLVSFVQEWSLHTPLLARERILQRNSAMSEEFDEAEINQLISLVQGNPTGSRPWTNIGKSMNKKRGTVETKYSKLEEDFEMAGLEGTFAHVDMGEKKTQKMRRHQVWTDQEHQLFLWGLRQHGWGCWMEISALFGENKDYRQILCHAHIYFGFVGPRRAYGETLDSMDQQPVTYSLEPTVTATAEV